MLRRHLNYSLTDENDRKSDQQLHLTRRNTIPASPMQRMRMTDRKGTGFGPSGRKFRLASSRVKGQELQKSIKSEK